MQVFTWYIDLNGIKNKTQKNPIKFLYRTGIKIMWNPHYKYPNSFLKTPYMTNGKPTFVITTKTLEREHRTLPSQYRSLTSYSYRPVVTTNEQFKYPPKWPWSGVHLYSSKLELQASNVQIWPDISSTAVIPNASTPFRVFSVTYYSELHNGMSIYWECNTQLSKVIYVL